LATSYNLLRDIEQFVLRSIASLRISARSLVLADALLLASGIPWRARLPSARRVRLCAASSLAQRLLRSNRATATSRLVQSYRPGSGNHVGRIRRFERGLDRRVLAVFGEKHDRPRVVRIYNRYVLEHIAQMAIGCR
jgi:hypothetical protein